ncbi:MAG TPA: ornithine cyclodeaminase family protein [Blastocatellia bacterium]|jgi:ornithine cyclodeaminase/alanine dehydrogenase
MLILNESHLRAVLEMKEVIAAVEAGFRSLARGDVRLPERLRLLIPERRAVMLEMPAYSRSLEYRNESTTESALGTKIVSVFEQNGDRNLAVVQSAYLLLDAETGVPISLMDGRFITAIRTAATSAVATKFMAVREVKQLAIFGAGVQAQFHVDAMMAVAQIERVMIASRTVEKSRALSGYVKTTYSTACEIVSPEEAASEASLICTCTTSPGPLFNGDLPRRGTHINAVGAYTPTTRELDTKTIRRARVIIDSELAAGREAGEILIPLAEGSIKPDHVKGALADVVSGEVSGREPDDELTVFRSCGLAIEDLVTARLAYTRATAEGVGTEVSF